MGVCDLMPLDPNVYGGVDPAELEYADPWATGVGDLMPLDPSADPPQASIWIIEERTVIDPYNPYDPARFRKRLIAAPTAAAAEAIARNNPVGDGFFFATVDPTSIKNTKDHRLLILRENAANVPGSVLGVEQLDLLPPPPGASNDPTKPVGPTLTSTPTSPMAASSGGQTNTGEEFFNQPDYLRALGLGFLADPPPGEDITPSLIRDPALLAPQTGVLPSLFRTPTLADLRRATPEGIQALQGAASTVGILPAELARLSRAVSPTGVQRGSVLA